MEPQIISTDPEPNSFQNGSEQELESEVRKFVVGTALHGKRVDACLAQLIPELSRSYLQQLIAQGDVLLNSRTPSKASVKVSATDSLEVCLRPTPQASSFRAEDVSLDVVFEDEHMLVINKPAGLVVHPAAGNWSGTMLNGLLFKFPSLSALPRAGIVHRLDKDTSGLMLVAKTRQCMDALVRMIGERRVSRLYLALAEGQWRRSTETTRVEQGIGRDPANRLRMAVQPLDKTGVKSAITDFVAVKPLAGVTLTACKLYTGRTHQIRVHLAWLGHPIIGDVLYGGHPLMGMNRQALHATHLELLHPVLGTALRFTQALPQDMADALASEGVTYNTSLLGSHLFGASRS